MFKICFMVSCKNCTLFIRYIFFPFDFFDLLCGRALHLLYLELTFSPLLSCLKLGRTLVPWQFFLRSILFLVMLSACSSQQIPLIVLALKTVLKARGPCCFHAALSFVTILPVLVFGSRAPQRPDGRSGGTGHMRASHMRAVTWVAGPLPKLLPLDQRVLRARQTVSQRSQTLSVKKYLPVLCTVCFFVYV